MGKKTDNSSDNKQNTNSYLNDYLEIMRTNTSDFISNTEWTSIGDQFEKLSMYDDYTPVETSSNTQTN